jgi:DNA-binding beta-propeller fold protein YncE
VLQRFDGVELDRDVFGVGVSPDGQRIALASYGGDVKVLDTRTGRPILSLPREDSRLHAVTFSPDGTSLATASRDGAVKVWDVATGQQVALPPLVGTYPGFRCVAFSPDGRHLVAGSMDRTVIFWDAATGKVKHTCRGHTDPVYCLVFSPNGERLATGSMDTTIRVWDTKTGKEILPPLTGHKSAVYSVAFSPDGKRLASGGGGSLKVWDATTGKEILSLASHDSSVFAVAFSPDGHRLASDSGDGVRIWDARPLTQERAEEDKALGLLASLFAKPLRKADVREFLNTTPTLPPAVQQKALALLERYREETSPEAYHQASWAVVWQPYLNDIQYRFALHQAETACRLAPESAWYRTTLGAAQYRAGQYREALATWTQAAALAVRSVIR